MLLYMNMPRNFIVVTFNNKNIVFIVLLTSHIDMLMVFTVWTINVNTTAVVIIHLRYQFNCFFIIVCAVHVTKGKKIVRKHRVF